MGKKKIDTERYIENPKQRQVAFYKRTKGAAKKLLELYHLCRAKIFSIILSETGKMIVINAGGSPHELMNQFITMKNNNKIFKLFTRLDQVKETSSKKKTSMIGGGSMCWMNEMCSYFEGDKLLRESEENESLNLMNDFLEDKFNLIC